MSIDDRVLVAAWSRHGATAEIARVIAQAIEDAGLSVDVLINAATPPSQNYRDVVIGSPVYGGFWCPGALAFARRHQELLERAHVWVFSSGMRPRAPDASVGLAGSHALANTNGYAYFEGRLDRSLLSRSERVVVDVIQARDKDARDWSQIREWITEVMSRDRTEEAEEV